jgi:hypothetical protein
MRSFGKPEGKKPLATTKHRFEDSIKINLKKRVSGCQLVKSV